jgi:hypothetical protein
MPPQAAFAELPVGFVRNFRQECAMTAPARNAQLLIWWILWFSILFGLVILYFFLSGSTASPSQAGLKFLPLLPLSFGAFVRWIVLPRASEASKALPLFLIGLALSEACGILGFILVPEMRQTYFVLALIGVFQFVPFFASRFVK